MNPPHSGCADSLIVFTASTAQCRMARPLWASSVDASIRIPATSTRMREAQVQYVVRAPVSLQNLLVDEGGTDTVVYRAPFSDFFKNDTKVSPAVRFLAEVLLLLPGSRCRLIRTYGLHSSHARGTHSPASALARREGGSVSPTCFASLPRGGSTTIRGTPPFMQVPPNSLRSSCPSRSSRVAPHGRDSSRRSTTWTSQATAGRSPARAR